MPELIQQPEFQKFEHLELLAKQVVEGFITGLHKSPLHGFSVEFAEHRLYNKGESTRYIDWKLYARTDKLFVKRYEEETNLRCQLIIDDSSSMYFPSDYSKSSTFLDKITFSVYAAASLIYLLRKQRDAVGLSVFSEDVEIHTAAKSSSVHHKYLFNKLQQLIEKKDTSRKTFAVDSLHRIAENTHRRSLVIIFSDMMDNSSQKTNELFSALKHLKHKKHEVVLFHVMDKNRELDFNFENRPYTFVDMETGEEVKAHPGQVKESYTRYVRSYEKELKLRCTQYRIDFVEADINKGFDSVLMAYLIKRERMC